MKYLLVSIFIFVSTSYADTPVDTQSIVAGVRVEGSESQVAAYGTVGYRKLKLNAPSSLQTRETMVRGSLDVGAIDGDASIGVSTDFQLSRTYRSPVSDFVHAGYGLEGQASAHTGEKNSVVARPYVEIGLNDPRAKIVSAGLTLGACLGGTDENAIAALGLGGRARVLLNSRTYLSASAFGCPDTESGTQYNERQLGATHVFDLNRFSGKYAAKTQGSVSGNLDVKEWKSGESTTTVTGDVTIPF